MKVGDLIRVSEKVHPSMGQNEIGVVIYVSKYTPAVDVLLVGNKQTHFLVDSLEVIS